MPNDYFTYSPRAVPLVGSAHTPGTGDNHVSSAYAAENKHFGSEYLGAGAPSATVPRAYDGVSHDMLGITGIADGEHNESIIRSDIRQVNSEITSRWNHAAPREFVGPIATHISYPSNHEDSARMNSHTTTAQGPVNVFNFAGVDIGQRRGAEARRKKPPLFSCPHVSSCGKAFTTKYRLETHWNRYHTAPESQLRFRCGNGDCDYFTYYSTDLSRHQRSCMARRLAHPVFDPNSPAESEFNFNFRG